jgi:hypothetical protein
MDSFGLLSFIVIIVCCFFPRFKELSKRENERPLALALPVLPLRFFKVPLFTAAGGLDSSLFVNLLD